MRIVTRFSLGFALALLPLVGVLAYVAAQVDRLATANQSVTTVQFQAITESARLFRQLELLEEYTEKYAVSDDARYVERVRESENLADAALNALLDLELSSGQRDETSLFSADWLDFRGDFGLTLAEVQSGARPTRELSPLLARLDGLRGRALDVAAATQATLDEEAAAAADVQSNTERMSWTVALGAVALSLVVFLLTFRAINRPLSELAAGTRAVARGEFSFQIADTGTGEFGALSRAFNGMVRSIYKLLRMKSEFVSHVSHELKTPLVSIQETSQLLLDEIPGGLNEKQRRLLELNVQATRRLAAMITDLLELSRAERGLRYDLHANDLGDLIRDSVAEFEARALDSQIKIITTLPAGALTVICDGDRITQVLQNFLDNALKHTPSGGLIEVRAAVAGDDVVPSGMREALADVGPFVLLEVDDSGPGLPAQERERVFERFYQAGGARAGGVGLGLAICQEIVSAHGGVVWAREGRLGGACFATLLPSAGRPVLPAAGPPSEELRT